MPGRELLARSAIVFQDFIRYALSAGDNIALGRHERALDMAGIVTYAELFTLQAKPYQ